MRSTSLVLIVPLVTVLLAAAVLGGGIATATARTIGQVIDDATIVAQVKAKLTADKLSNLTKIDVTSDSGVVTLSGTVDSLERRNRAAQIASAVSGVKSVVNDIDVAGAPLATPVAPSTGAPLEATGTVASVDPASGTITLQDGRVLKATDQTMVWQPTSVGALKPGAQVLVRGATPAGFQPGASSGARDWRMGTVSRVDSGARQLVLNDGTVVRVTSGTNIHRGANRLALEQIDPGAEVVVRTAPVTVGGGAEGSALPRQTASAPTLDASEVSVLWTPAPSSR
jgi:BON domain